MYLMDAAVILVAKLIVIVEGVNGNNHINNFVHLDFDTIFS